MARQEPGAAKGLLRAAERHGRLAGQLWIERVGASVTNQEDADAPVHAPSGGMTRGGTD